jgi:hypothetical protein
VLKLPAVPSDLTTLLQDLIAPRVAVVVADEEVDEDLEGTEDAVAVGVVEEDREAVSMIGVVADREVCFYKLHLSLFFFFFFFFGLPHPIPRMILYRARLTFPLPRWPWRFY